MADPLVITIAHRLGRDEAKHRIERGLGQVRAQAAPFVGALDLHWTGYRLDLAAAALGQRIEGCVEIEDALVRVTLGLPALLRLVAGTIGSRVQGAARRLLDKPGG